MLVAVMFPIALVAAVWSETVFIQVHNFAVCGLLVTLCLMWLPKPATTYGTGLSQAGLAVFLVLIANAMAPLFEVKSAYSMNMYSNIVTADGFTNHLLVGRTFDLTGFQADRIHIERGPSHDWHLYRDEGVWLARGALGSAIDYASRELCVRAQTPSGQSERLCQVGKRSPASKLFLFRRFTLGKPQKCRIQWGPAG